MNIHFIFPSIPFDSNIIDASYEAECNFCASAGFSFSFVDTDSLQDGKLSLSKKHHIPDNSIIIYRGWMLNEKQYSTLSKAEDKGFKLLTSKENYFKSHYINGWYDSVKDFTMPTIFCTIDTLIDTMQSHNLNTVFVKDYVKSLTTSEGSIAKSPEEALKIAKLIESYRGFIDGGIALRKVVNLNEKLENRYFVINGNVLSNDENIPEIALLVAKIHNAPFYTIDIGKTVDNEDILIEIGDGQVSDLKQWDAYKLYSGIKNVLHVNFNNNYKIKL